MNSPAGRPARSASTRQRERRERRLAGGLGDHGAAGRQRRRHLARQHGVGEIPRRDRGDDADRLLDDDDPLVWLVAGDGVAIDALGFLAEPFDIGRAIEDLALGLGERLAHLGGQDRGEVVGIGHHQVVELAQHRRALLAGLRGPRLLRLLGGVDGALGFGTAHVRQRGEHLAGRGIGDVEGLAAVALLQPFAGDQRLVGSE